MPRLFVIVSIILVALVRPSSAERRDGAPVAIEERLGIEWQEIEGNPLLTGGSCPSWRCAGVSDPAIAVAPDGSLKVWFTTMGLHLSWRGFQADGPVLGMATGASPGNLTVSPESAVIPVGHEGTWDRYVETPTVRRSIQGPGWTMWYAGYASRGEGANPFIGIALGQMTSPDPEGKVWKRSDTPIYRATPGAWDSRLVTGPTVLRGPDEIWRLYYSGAGTKQGVGLLTSKDGLHWTPYAGNPVLEPQPDAWDEQILEQAAIYFNGHYWLWYSGYKNPLQPTTTIAIGLATSDDGAHWKRYANNPVIKPGPPGSWDDLRVVAPDVVVEPDGSLLMAAYGAARKDIGNQAGFIGLWRSKK